MSSSDLFSSSTISSEETILVTGSNGFIGARVVNVLLNLGFNRIRCLVRPGSSVAHLASLIDKHNAESRLHILRGDLSSRDDCQSACNGVSTLYHLAASFGPTYVEVLRDSVVATQSLLEAFALHGKPRKAILVSSFSVYTNLGLSIGELIDENSPTLDVSANGIDPYTVGKLKQEELFRLFANKHHIPVAILRPGAVFGPGKRALTGRIGRKISRCFVLVSGTNMLPMTYVDNCADAIVLAGLNDAANGEIFNIVDNEQISSRQFLQAYRAIVPGVSFQIEIPYWLTDRCAAIWEWFAHYLKRAPGGFTRLRCAAEWKANRYTNKKARNCLGWSPRVPMQASIDRFLRQFASGSEARH